MSWPCCWRRIVMLPPIRPSPIIPSCISGSPHLVESQARDPAAALLQRLVVSGRLRAYQPRESEVAPGDLQLLALIVDDLKTEHGVRTTFVQLAGRVEVARPEAVRDYAAGL